MQQLRVWWIRNPPAPAKYFPVKNVKEAVKVLNRLAKADLKNKGITDNAGGVEEFDEKDKKWYEFYDKEGRDISEIIDGE